VENFENTRARILCPTLYVLIKKKSILLIENRKSKMKRILIPKHTSRLLISKSEESVIRLSLTQNEKSGYACFSEKVKCRIFFYESSNISIAD
jgi:hypothetical protein